MSSWPNVFERVFCAKALPQRVVLLTAFALLLSACAPTRMAEAPQSEDPTLFIIGDSTVKHGSGEGNQGLWGWGAFLGEYFTGINVENHAIGGRSSRTFQTEGRWADVLDDLKKGDYVIMQFGHNDGIAPDDPHRPRGSLRGTGDETYDIIHPKTGEPETVHTYGWYMRKYVNDAQAQGATSIIVSPIPRNIWNADGTVVRNRPGYGLWAQEAAKETGAYFIDLNDIVAQHYEAEGPGPVKKKYFGKDHTHTTEAGAKLNARSVVAGMKGLESLSLKQYFSDTVENVEAIDEDIVTLSGTAQNE